MLNAWDWGIFFIQQSLMSGQFSAEKVLREQEVNYSN